jgi:hypothetical protein
MRRRKKVAVSDFFLPSPRAKRLEMSARSLSKSLSVGKCWETFINVHIFLGGNVSNGVLIAYR